MNSQEKSFDLAHQLGSMLAFSVETTDRPTLEEHAQFEAGLAAIEEVAHKLDPVQAVEGFLLGLGAFRSKSLPDTMTRELNVSEDPGRQARMSALKAQKESADRCEEIYQQSAATAVDRSGKGYRQSIIPRLMADTLTEIFGEDRNPGDVLDEAIESRFDVADQGRSLVELKRIASNAHRRVGALPALGIRLLLLWLASAMAPRWRPPSEKEVEAAHKLVRILFFQEKCPEDARIALGMHLGGMLGFITLLSFKSRFDVDSIDANDAEKEAQARAWSERMVTPMGNLPSELWEYGKSLENLRQLGWSPSTDFLLNLETLSAGQWFYDDDRSDESLQAHVHEQIRIGSKLALWHSGGKYDVAPTSALGPSLFRDHNFNRGAELGRPWDLCVSLLPLSDGGHAAHWRAVRPFPHPDFLKWAYQDAIEEQQWELAEAFASLWLLQCYLLELERSPPSAAIISTLHWQREKSSHEYGFLAPTCRFLAALNQTEEFRRQDWIEGLETLSKIFVSTDRSTFDPGSIKGHAVRSELVSRLVGPVFMELPGEIKSKLVEVVLKHRLLAAHAGHARLKHFGGETVSLVSPLEHLLRLKLATLSQQAIEEIKGLGLRFDPTMRDTMTLGPMVHVFKFFPRFSDALKVELRQLFPSLPLKGDQQKKLFTVFRLRNDGAHDDVALAEYDVAWSLLFTTSPQDARDNPGLYALLGKRIAL